MSVRPQHVVFRQVAVDCFYHPLLIKVGLSDTSWRAAVVRKVMIKQAAWLRDLQFVSALQVALLVTPTDGLLLIRTALAVELATKESRREAHRLGRACPKRQVVTYRRATFAAERDAGMLKWRARTRPSRHFARALVPHICGRDEHTASPPVCRAQWVSPRAPSGRACSPWHPWRPYRPSRREVWAGRCTPSQTWAARSIA